MGEVKKDKNFIAGLLAEGDDANATPTPIKAVSTTGRLKVDSNSGDGTATTGTAIGTVTTAGTRVQLGDNACRRCFIQAYADNTGTIVVGDVACVAAVATQRGIAFFATQGDWFNVSNTNLLYIDSTVSGEKVSIYLEV